MENGSGRYFVGLDLGQTRDPSAVAVVERADVYVNGMDYASYERLRGQRFRVVFLERVRLGTPYPDVVERVRALARKPALTGRCTLAVDATGVGAPVVDMLRRASLGCELVPVTITGGDRASQAGGVWHVPKRDLVTGLLVSLESGELRLSMKVASARVLHKELEGMESRVSRAGGVAFGGREGEHDDLVMALALASWRARFRREGVWGTRSLGL
jgi:hypothetical protein